MSTSGVSVVVPTLGRPELARLLTALAEGLRAAGFADVAIPDRGETADV